MKKLKNIKAAFIDLDGTLLDSERIYQIFWKESFKEHGYDVSLIDPLNLRSLDRNLANEYLKSIYGDSINLDEIRFTRNKLMKEYLDKNDYEIKPFVKEGLAYLNSKNIDCYVVSATKKEEIINLLNKYDLAKYFKNVFSTKDIKRGKPYPDVYLGALKFANVNPKNSIAIEDSPNGVLSAFNAKMNVIMVIDLTNPNKNLRKNVYRTIKNFNSLKYIV